MFRRTLIILIISTLGGLAVYADIAGGVAGTVTVRVAGPLSGKETLTTGLVITAGMFSAHHDVPLGTQFFLVVRTVFHSAS